MSWRGAMPLNCAPEQPCQATRAVVLTWFSPGQLGASAAQNFAYL